MDHQLMRLARRYAVGGGVEDLQMPNPAGLPELPLPAGAPQGMPQEPPMPQGAPAMPSGAQPQMQQSDPLAALYARWQPQQGAYDQELRAAQARERAEQQAFQQLIEQSTQQKTQTPSQAEMYFRLAAAFGAPTRTGSFSESLGNASTVLADMEKLKREAASGDRKTALEAQFKLRGLGLQTAKDETATLRQLAAQDAQNQRQLMLQEAQGIRQLQLEKMRELIKSGQPQSNAGKAAQDAGLRPGTPEFSDFVKKYIADELEAKMGTKEIMAMIAQQNANTSGMMAGLAAQRLELDKDKADRAERDKAKLTPKELDLKIETEDAISGLKGVQSTLADALKLNPQTFDSSLGDKAQRMLLENTQSNHPKVKATREQEQMLAEQAVSGLKASFGGNPTEGERKIILELQGIGAKSKEERETIIKRALAAADRRRKFQEKRLSLVNAGQYRDTTPETPATSPTE